MELKYNNHIFTLGKEKVLYSRIVHARLLTIYIEVDEVSTYQEVMTKLNNMTKLDDDMVKLLSTISREEP